MRIPRAIAGLAAVFLLTYCSRNKDMKPAEPAPQENILNVAYGSDAKQTFNIYLPAGRTEETTPTLFFIFGGAWIEGDKDSITAAVPYLRSLFPTSAIVLFNYRLYDQGKGNFKFPAQEQDVKDCIEKVLNNSSTYKISKNFVLWGQSAGAQLAMLYAYKYGKTSFKPLAVVEQVGPSDMLSFYKQSKDKELKKLLVELMGNPNSADTVLYNSSSPLKYITADSPPTLVMHGTADDVVPYQQAELLRRKLEQYGVPHVYKLYPNEGHELSGVDDESTEEVLAFLKKYLK
ncbi:alpha/beta hydrolase [Larkinella soli]|uniref:alpha/beta hydrolase n=1 Tax=Larkinella soli TaxID=1770527 RepID=UPI000FFC35AA|nr:alpha/beta hydrolase [Larkinella soli]